MAFYDKAPGNKKKVSYGEMGSWDEEGTHYGKNRAGGSKGSMENKSGKTGYGSARKSADRRMNGNSSGSAKDRFADPKRGHRQFVKKENSAVKGDFGRSRPENRTRNALHDDEAYITEKRESDFRDFEYRAPSAERGTPSEPENILCGRNPIREALRENRDIEKLLVQKGELSGTAREIIAMAKERKVLIQEVDRSRLDEITQHHQGMIAFASAYQYAEVEDMLRIAEERNEAPFLILLDGVTDPHNLGAIIRSAECAGAHGVIVPLHRSVGLTPAAVKASAGAVEHVPVARVINLNRTIEDLKNKGIWIYAVTMNGTDYEKVDFHGGTALVIGAEGEGISRLTLGKCDMAVSLPMKGKLDSLNASVAAGLMMYRVLSSRRG